MLYDYFKDKVFLILVILFDTFGCDFYSKKNIKLFFPLWNNTISIFKIYFFYFALVYTNFSFFLFFF